MLRKPVVIYLVNKTLPDPKPNTRRTITATKEMALLLNRSTSSKKKRELRTKELVEINTTNKPILIK